MLSLEVTGFVARFDTLDGRSCYDDSGDGVYYRYVQLQAVLFVH